VIAGGAGWVWVWERLDRYGGHRVDMAFFVVVTAKEGAVAGLGPVFASALHNQTKRWLTVHREQRHRIFPSRLLVPVG